MRMKARYWIAVGGVVLAFGIYATAVQSVTPTVHWDFLEGQSPLRDELTEFGWRMDGVIHKRRGRSSDDGPAVLVHTREFVYRADHRTVLAEARNEAELKGCTTFGDGSAFELDEKSYLYVHKGKYDPVSGITDAGAPFVRVTVIEVHKEGGLGQAKRWIRSQLR